MPAILPVFRGGTVRCCSFWRKPAIPGAASMLDIGAGGGALVAAGRRQGLQADGIEPSDMLVEAAKRHFHVSLVHGVLPDVQLPRNAYDLVFLVNVIEHTANPVELLKSAARLLSDAGVMVVVTPDVHSFAARLLTALVALPPCAHAAISIAGP